jgi:hypothetical protein
MYVDYHHKDSANPNAGVGKSISDAIGFNDDDLAMNKAGKMSTRQMIRLSFQVLAPFAGLVSGAAGLVALGIAVYLAGPMLMNHYRLMMSLGKYLTLGLGALFFGLIAFIMKLIFASGRVLQFLVDVMEGKVASVNGRMNASKSEDIEDGLSTITKQKTETFNCVIKGEYFDIDEEAYLALHECSGNNYRAYVTPRSRILVSIEPSVPDAGGRDPFKLEYQK